VQGIHPSLFQALIKACPQTEFHVWPGKKAQGLWWTTLKKSPPFPWPFKSSVFPKPRQIASTFEGYQKFWVEERDKKGRGEIGLERV
jgi:hypothetical protein